MAEKTYSQQMLQGDRIVGFRNSSDEPWEMYWTEPNGAVFNFGRTGYEPKPEWVAQ